MHLGLCLLPQLESQRATRPVGLAMGQHVPNDSCHSPHHSNSRDFRPAPRLDSAIPFSHDFVFSKHVDYRLSEMETDNPTAFFGDRAEAICFLTRVATSWS